MRTQKQNRKKNWNTFGTSKLEYRQGSSLIMLYLKMSKIVIYRDTVKERERERMEMHADCDAFCRGSVSA